MRQNIIRTKPNAPHSGPWDPEKVILMPPFSSNIERILVAPREGICAVRENGRMRTSIGSLESKIPVLINPMGSRDALIPGRVILRPLGYMACADLFLSGTKFPSGLSDAVIGKGMLRARALPLPQF